MIGQNEFGKRRAGVHSLGFSETLLDIVELADDSLLVLLRGITQVAVASELR